LANTSDFDKLTEKVSLLIVRFNELKENNKRLEEKILEYEKDKLRTKAGIDKIITKIEELEVG